ncbi:MAG: AMP-binding protein, partial [Thermodesulfobacteriota bacterium]
MTEMQDFYKQVMELNSLQDMQERKKKARSLFGNLKNQDIPEYFNWAEEIFEGIHVRERGDQKALIWADMESGEEKSYTYREFAENGNKCLNFIRRQGLDKGSNLYLMSPIVPETWFAHYAAAKGGLIAVPTATSMTVRELKFRFETYPPDVIVADQSAIQSIDEALENANTQPSVKIVLGEGKGWTSYAEIDQEAKDAQPAKLHRQDLLFCFFTSGTTGMPKRVGHTASSYPVGHLSTAVMIGIQPGDIHHNLSAPGW